MKQLEFLVDENISPLISDHFRDLGYNFEAVRDIMKGAPDTEVGEYALINEKIIITLDKDFGEIFFHVGISVILLRLKNALPTRIISALEHFFEIKKKFNKTELPKLYVITEKKVRETNHSV